MRHLLVFAERDDAEEVAETLAEWFPRLGLPPVVRETLAGEDDADDAQWVVVAEGLAEQDVARVGALAEKYDGWVESD